HDHSTHVAGTMIAAGTNMSAIGMAYNGTLIDYDWDNDDSEMSSAGAAGALISNHSYSMIRGWYYNYFDDGLWAWFGDPAISQTEDCYFGFYGDESQNWDNIAYNAPYLLICKSAGNERSDNGPTPGANHWAYNWSTDTWYYSSQIRDPDGDYDCIGVKGVAKNVLTVGAVNDILGGYTNSSQVVATSFTSWGPADDGRIKPDITANGQHLYSPISTGNSEYAYKSGTSMSTPSVAGSAALLQEHYSELYRTYMLSSTLKGLIIHTADEAGPNPGPDYMFGWGLMNTEKAAALITEHGESALILEDTLENGETFTMNVSCASIHPLIATLCWTDPAGIPTIPQVDPTTPMLVNDLDIRISGPAITHYPWKLNRNNPAAAATNNGDNSIDNVEKIEILTPENAEYTISITHKGTLSSSQNFSLILSGIIVNPPAISVNPLTFDISLPPETTGNETFRISNSGTGELVYDCDIEFLSRSQDNNQYNKEIVIELESMDNTLNPEKLDFGSIELISDLPERDEAEIHYDNGNIAGSLGCGGSAYFTIATRFTPEELDPYYGGYALIKIKFFISSWPFTSLTLKVWKGGEYGNPGNEIYSQDVTSSVVSNSWNELELTSPISLMADYEYWLGYYITTNAESYPSCYDNGSCEVGKGLWLSWFGGDWQDLYESGWNCNWVLRGVVTPQWLSITTNAGSTVPGTSRAYLDVSLLFDTAGLSAGTEKTANIIINSNDPYNPEIILPVTMNVIASVPDPPDNLIISRSEDAILIEWEAVPGVSSYAVYSDTNPYGSFSVLEDSGVTGTSWSDSDIGSEKKYYIIKSEF
ncbi:MAG: S8 family serine peptidase, partial [Candidatus Cloacimonetes bacterium]|nr:S8 family serine peptidase [Candidatus Cloacimonadota bacterium]